MIVALLALAQVLAAPTLAPHRAVRANVVYFSDGDTLRIDKKWSSFSWLNWDIRVNNIDTPEHDYRAKCDLEKQRGIAALVYVNELLKIKGKRVLLDNVDHDKYGSRLVADVQFRDGTDLATDLLNHGYAKPYFGVGPKPDWCTPAPTPAG